MSDGNVNLHVPSVLTLPQPVPHGILHYCGSVATQDVADSVDPAPGISLTDVQAGS